jgi:hypothetical protein
VKRFDSRLRALETRLGVSNAQPRILYIVSRIVQRLGLDRQTCIQILDEGGFLRKRGYMSVDLALVPDGLSAEETKRFLLENGAKICPSGAAQGSGAPGKERDGCILRPQSSQQTGHSVEVKDVEAGETFHIRLNTG